MRRAHTAQAFSGIGSLSQARLRLAGAGEPANLRSGQGWFLGFHVFTNYVKVTFFRGTSRRPVPPGGTGKDARWIDVHEEDLDEAQMATWIRQAAMLPGWGKS